MSDIVLLSGSPSINSGSEILLDVSSFLLKKKDYHTSKIAVTDIPWDDLYYGQSNSPTIDSIIKEITGAKGMVISSPVYNASYTGLLKLLIDVLPRNAFHQKAVLPVMTGGSPAHLLALEYSLKPLIAVLKGESLGGVYVIDSQIDKQKEYPITDQDIFERLDRQVNLLHESIQKKAERYRE